MFKRLLTAWTILPVALVAVLASGCHNNLGPSDVPDCELDDTGELVLTNLAETRTPRDAYVDQRFVGTVAFGGEIVLDVDAGVVHLIEWVSTFGGGTVDAERVPVDTCRTYRLTNFF